MFRYKVVRIWPGQTVTCLHTISPGHIWTTLYIYDHTIILRCKVKLSYYRPGRALGVTGGWRSRISRQLAHEGGKIVSPTHRPTLPPGRIPGTHFCYRLSRPQGHNATGRIKSLKNSSDSIGNRTRDLPVRSTVPQPTVPPRTHILRCGPSV
jgi:hypothetical protein